MRNKRIASILIALLLWIYWSNITIQTTRIEIENDKIPAAFDGFTIVHVSDLHNHQWGKQLINQIKIESPDIIAITGDLVDSTTPDFNIALTFIEQAQQLAPIYYVTGNHEAWLDDYFVLEKQLEQAGVCLLDDHSVWLEKNNARIQLSGLQDPDFVERTNNRDIQSAIIQNKLEKQLHPTSFNLVLSHRPENFDSYVESSADLVLTGHAHGGQIRIPFLGGLIAPNQGLFPKYTAGIHHQGETDMVVSRGLGNSIIPIRINNRPELVVIRLKSKERLNY